MEEEDIDFKVTGLTLLTKEKEEPDDEIEDDLPLSTIMYYKAGPTRCVNQHLA